MTLGLFIILKNATIFKIIPDIFKKKWIYSIHLNKNVYPAPPTIN